MGEMAFRQGRPSIKVLAVVPGPDDWQAAFVRRQMASMQDLGCIVELFFLCSRTNGPKLLRERRRLRARIREFGPDLIHAHFGTMTAFFAVTATRVPVVVTFRGSDLNPSGPDDGKLRLAFGHFLSQISGFLASRIICVSEEVRSRVWLSKSKATIIPTGVDLGLFRPVPQQLARRKLGWNLDGRVVLFSAGLAYRNKGGDLVQQAVAIARTLVGNVALEVMDGHTEPDDVCLVMNAADCLVFASRYEGSPNVVKEAIACDLPVVTVDVGDVRDRLAGVEPSAIVPRDPEAMGKALAKILKSRSRSNGHQMIQTLSLEAVAVKILEVYRLAGKKPGVFDGLDNRCEVVYASDDTGKGYRLQTDGTEHWVQPSGPVGQRMDHRPRSYQVCDRCVMDTSIRGISFEAGGGCTYCRAAEQRLSRESYSGDDSGVKLRGLLADIKAAGRGKPYDCVLGVSGGVDSSYTAFLAKRTYGLRPLAVHFDNGWNSELAVQNIERLLKVLDIDLYTHVVDWEEFKDLQLAFLRASVANCEIPTDHGIVALLYRTAAKHGIKYIMHGGNLATESIMPDEWMHDAKDLRFLKSIWRRFGRGSLRTMPTMSYTRLAWYILIRRIRYVSLLNYGP